MMARFTTRCGCMQEKHIPISRDFLPRVYSLPLITPCARAYRQPGEPVAPTTIPTREFQLLRFDPQGVAEYLEIER